LYNYTPIIKDTSVGYVVKRMQQYTAITKGCLKLKVKIT